MIARNIAPGRNRSFAFEYWDWYDKNHKKNTLQSLTPYPSGKYHIIASDINEDMIEIAQENARRAGVSDDIEFRVADAKSYITKYQ